MKKKLTLILIIAHLTTLGQVATLDIIDPGPRIGETLEINISIEKQKLKTKNKNGVYTKDEWTAISNNNLGSGQLKFYEILSDTGQITVGPFTFLIDGTQIISDTLVVKVYPGLPAVEDGLWIRQISHLGKDFIVLEQRVFNRRKSNNSNKRSRDSDGVVFARINTERLKEYGVNLYTINSSTSSEVVGEDDTIGSGTVSFQKLIYEVRRTEEFKGQLKLKQDFFVDYPKEVGFPTIVIN
jgi:hypothetical protein